MLVASILCRIVQTDVVDAYVQIQVTFITVNIIPPSKLTVGTATYNWGMWIVVVVFMSAWTHFNSWLVEVLRST